MREESIGEKREQVEDQLRSPPKLQAEDSEDMPIRTTMQQTKTQGYSHLIILNTNVSENVLNSGGTGEEKKIDKDPTQDNSREK